MAMRKFYVGKFAAVSRQRQDAGAGRDKVIFRTQLAGV
jgi:hypothetical protein